MAGGIGAVLANGADGTVLHDSDLTGIQFPVKRGADGGEGTGFRGKDYGIAPMSHAQGAKPLGIPGSDEFLRGHDDQGIGAAQIF